MRKNTSSLGLPSARDAMSAARAWMVVVEWATNATVGRVIVAVGKMVLTVVCGISTTTKATKSFEWEIKINIYKGRSKSVRSPLVRYRRPRILCCGKKNFIMCQERCCNIYYIWLCCLWSFELVVQINVIKFECVATFVFIPTNWWCPVNLAIFIFICMLSLQKLNSIYIIIWCGVLGKVFVLALQRYIFWKVWL